MTVGKVDSYLGKIEELLKDRSQIVTAKTASESLKLPVKSARNVLDAYIDRFGENDKSLNATYIVTGTLAATGGSNLNSVGVVLTPASDLSKTKAKFDTVSSVQIYSLQQVRLKNSDLIYLTDKNTHPEGGIRPCSGILRAPIPKPTIPNKQEVSTSKEAKVTGKPVAPVTKTTSLPVPQKNGSPSKPTTVPRKDSYSAAGAAKSFQNLFKGVNQVKKAKSDTSHSHDSQSRSLKTEAAKKTEEKPEKSKSNGKSPAKKQELPRRTSPRKDRNSAKVAPQPKKQPESKRKRRKLQSDTDSDDGGPKKRNRLSGKKYKRVVMSDSDSEEEQENEVILDSPSPPPVAVASIEEKPERQEVYDGKKRVKKWVDKTFVDDAGYMVTKKVMITCSDGSDEEVEAEKEVKKEVKPDPVVTEPPKLKKKQSTLLGFFSKK